MRDVNVITNVTQTQTIQYPHRTAAHRSYFLLTTSLTYAPLVTSAWQHENRTSLLITATAVQQNVYVKTSFIIDGRKYEIDGVMCEVMNVFPPPSFLVTLADCNNIQWSVTIGPRGVRAWTIRNILN
jgi:hypothetical protein